MLSRKNLNFSIKEVFLIICYLICWFSISTKFEDVSYFYNTFNSSSIKISTTNIINFFRQFLNLSILPFLLFLFFKNFKKIKLKDELLFIFAFCYFFSQIFGIFLTDNSLNNLVYVISSLNILLIFYLANIFFKQEKYILFIYATFFMLLLIFLLNYKTFLVFFSMSRGDTLYTFFSSSETYLGKDSPRSTGSSRTILLIYIISLIIFYKFFLKHNIIKLSLYAIMACFVILFQSRTSIVLLISFVTLNYIFEKKFSIFETFRYFLVYLLTPIILMYSILILKDIVHSEIIKEKYTDTKIQIYMNKINNQFIRPMDPVSKFSSGRIEDWRNIFNKMDQSIIYGYGAQGDRFLINQSASNGILYAYASSGLLGLIFFISFSIYSSMQILNIFFRSYQSNLIFPFLSSIIIFIILLRSILESSYAVFSVDFIIIYTFLNYLKSLKLSQNER